MKIHKLLLLLICSGVSLTNHADASNDPIQIGLTIDICLTNEQKDDYICVSDASSDCPFTKVKVTLSGDPGGPEHSIKLERIGDGDIKIDTPTFNLKCGESKIVTVWGTKKSSAVDSTIIEGFVDDLSKAKENANV